MKRSLTLTMILLVMGLGTVATADTFTFRPGPAADYDLNDLDHYMAITWRITPVVPVGQVVTGAKLTFTNIYNWQDSSTDRLFINLLDTAKVITGTPPSGTTRTDAYGVTYTTDSYPTIADYFDTPSGATRLVANSTARMSLIDAIIPADAPGGPVGITYDLDFATVPGALTTLKSFIANGNDFAFGFDPDCHYFNSGATFTLTTGSPLSAVPEPSSVVLMGTMGVVAIRLLRKRKATA